MRILPCAGRTLLCVILNILLYDAIVKIAYCVRQGQYMAFDVKKQTKNPAFELISVKEMPGLC